MSDRVRTLKENYKIVRVEGLGFWKRRKTIGLFEQRFVAEHNMLTALARAKMKRKKIRLELIDVQENTVITKVEGLDFYTKP